MYGGTYVFKTKRKTLNITTFQGILTKACSSKPLLKHGFSSDKKIACKLHPSQAAAFIEKHGACVGVKRSKDRLCGPRENAFLVMLLGKFRVKTNDCQETAQTGELRGRWWTFY